MYRESYGKDFVTISRAWVKQLRDQKLKKLEKERDEEEKKGKQRVKALKEEERVSKKGKC